MDNCCILKFFRDGLFHLTQCEITQFFSATEGPPVLKISAGIASDPGAMPDDRSFTAFTVSGRAGNSSSSGLHSTCGSLWITSSLIDDGHQSGQPILSRYPFCQSED